jgi:hypothetical protein
MIEKVTKRIVDRMGLIQTWKIKWRSLMRKYLTVFITLAFIFMTVPAISNVVDIKSRKAPEPSTLIILGAGLVGIAAIGRKKFKK